MCIDNYLSQLVPGEVIDARVTHIEPFGCFVDIGCGIPSMISIDEISVSRISSPADRFDIDQMIKVVFKRCDKDMYYEIEDFIAMVRGELDPAPWRRWSGMAAKLLDEARSQAGIDYRPHAPRPEETRDFV